MVRIRNCTSDQFMEWTKEKKLVCICAGVNFEIFCREYPIVSRIECVVDNFKAGTRIRLAEKEIPVIAMEQLDKQDEETVLVLTSVKVADEILPQLDQNQVLDDQILFVPELFECEQTDVVLEIGAVQRIPKVIHYCWFGNKPIPRHFLENIDTWKTCSPDYEIKQWNEGNYDVSKNKYMLQAYENKKWGFVPDYARLDIIASYGGIYLDTDVRMVRSFDPLLQFGLFCGFESRTRVNFGQGFGARKDHPMIREMLLEYEKADFINPDGSLNIEPSPVYQTRTLEKLGMSVNGKLQKIEDAIVFPPEYFSPVNEFGYGLPTKNTFSIHEYDGSWYDEAQRRVKERVIRNYEYLSGRISASQQEKTVWI